MTYEPLVAVTRGEIDESIHFGAIAVVTADGRLVASAGSPETVTFMRSSAKPLQVIPLIESGAADHFRFTPAEIAIAIGSHNGEPRHVETVASMLSKLGLSEEALMCGAHAPYHRDSARRLEAEGKRPTAIHNNCSGKHAGMLALALFRGSPPEGYFRAEHPVQREILETVASICGVEASRIALGIDGCSVPTFGITLSAAATGFARLMEPDRFRSSSRYAAHRAVEAMIAHPEMIGGIGRIDTDLMSSTKGDLVSKVGAEGFHAIGFRRDGKGYGLALKISDGDSDRARAALVLRALADLGLMTADKIEALSATYLPPLKNRRGIVVGKVEARFHLEPPSASS